MCACKRGIGTILLAAFLATAGCAPAIESGNFVPGPPAPPSDAASIRIYELTIPACEFIELGMVRATARHGWHSLEEMLAGMRQHAARMGGDAIVGLSTHVTTGTAEPGEQPQRNSMLSGSVVRLAEGCDRNAVRPRVGPAGGGR